MIGLIGEDYFRTIVTVNFEQSSDEKGPGKVADEALELLVDTPHVRDLILRGNEQLTDQCLRHAAGLNRLRALALSGTSISGAGLSYLNAPDLELLSIENGLFDDTGLREVAKFPNLTSLLIRNTKITDSGLSSLYALRSLNRVDLRGNEVSEEACTALELALPGCKVLRDRKRQVSSATNAEAK